MIGKRHVLPRDFYDRDPALVARELLGKLLVHVADGSRTAGRIVETEAYLAAGDPACHAARGKTARNSTMFGQPGYAYVYMIHARYCLNAVTEPEGVASAVLIRAVEPLEGLEVMQQRRKRQRLLELTRGPARLCEAFGITRDRNGWDMTRGNTLYISDDQPRPDEQSIVAAPRIGISSGHHLPLRFYYRANQFVSKRMKNEG